MLKLKFILPSALMLLLLPSITAQAVPTAVRRINFQAGVAGSSYTLDYNEGREKGFTIYGDVDLGSHLGVEALYRNASIVTPHDIGENHILIGPRFHIDRGRFSPYAKALIGRGTINFQLGYNLVASSQSYIDYAFGAGLDLHVTPRINVRLIDYEYQTWPGFPPHGLTPTGLSAGVAYRF